MKPKGKRHLRPEQALAIVALVRAGEHRRDVANRFGIGTAEVSHIMTGRAWSGTTGIRPPNSIVPSDQHTTVLLKQLAAQPEKADIVRTIFDRKFGNGAALRTVRRVLSARA